jgi:hypothetical protein
MLWERRERFEKDKNIRVKDRTALEKAGMLEN